MKLNYIDIHSHLQERQFDEDRSAVLVRMQEKGIGSLIVGVDYATSERATALVQEHSNLWAVIGVHPVDTKTEVFSPDTYDTLIAQGKVVAIGECGLEYFRMDSAQKEADKPRQVQLFEDQIQYALRHDLPLMLHCRPTPHTMDSYEDVLDILESYARDAGEKLRGNVHFFVGDTAIAQRFLNLGFTLSFTGVVTFTSQYDEVIRYTPQDMIQAETDAPYVAPVPHRGQRNESCFLPETVQRIATIKGVPTEQMQETLVDNAVRVFGISREVR